MMDSKILIRLKEVIQEVGKDSLEGIVIFGSATEQLTPPNDIDILIILRALEIPRRKKRQLGAAIRRKLWDLPLPVELYIWNKKQFASLSLMHFGIGLNYSILYDQNGWIQQVFVELHNLMKQWGTKKIVLPDKTWLILPKGEILKEGTFPLGQELLPLEKDSNKP